MERAGSVHASASASTLASGAESSVAPASSPHGGLHGGKRGEVGAAGGAGGTGGEGGAVSPLPLPLQVPIPINISVTTARPPARERRRSRRTKAQRTKTSSSKRAKRKKTKKDKKAKKKTKRKKKRRHRSRSRPRRRRHDSESNSESNSQSDSDSSESDSSSRSSSSSSSDSSASGSSRADSKGSETSDSAESARARRRGRKARRQRARNQESAAAAAALSALSAQEARCAVSIQSRWRGWCARRAREELDRAGACRDYVEQLIEEYLRGEFIPDVLIEVFTHKGNEYDPVSAEEQVAYEELQLVMNGVVHSEIEGIVKGAVRDFITDFLEFHATRRKRDPVQEAVQVLVDEVVRSLAEDTVRDCLQAMVDDFLFMKQFDILLESFLAPMIADIACDGVYEGDVGDEAEGLLAGVLDEVTAAVAVEAIEDQQQLMEARRRRSEFRQISGLLDSVLQRAMLQHLLRTVASRGENVLFREQMQLLMTQQVAAALYHRACAVTDTQVELAQNRALRAAFQATAVKVLTTTVADAFFLELDHFEACLDDGEAEQAPAAVPALPVSSLDFSGSAME